MLWGDVMSKMTGKLVSGFIILVVVVTAIVSFREGLLSSGAEYDAFVAVFDCFPFANEMAAMAANIGQFGVTLQGLTPTNVLDDIAKIFGMAVICPLAIGITTAMCLKVPDYKDWYDKEQYMNSMGYRLKECALSVIMMPMCAYLTTWGLELFQASLQQKMPAVGSGLISLAVMILVFLASLVIGAIFKPMSMGFLVRHRLVHDLLGGVLKILGLNCVCFLIVLAILNDQGNVALMAVVTMFIYLAGIDLLIGAVTGSAGKS